jgi:hypothetical protein
LLAFRGAQIFGRIDYQRDTAQVVVMAEKNRRGGKPMLPLPIPSTCLQVHCTNFDS